MSNSSIVHTSDATFDKDVLKSDRPVLLDFWAEWCGPCKMIAPILDEIAEQYKDKVRIAQGNMSVTADQGQASREALGGNFDNSLWIFRGNVKITMEQGQLTSDDAQVSFIKKLLAKAVANGKPAQFQQRIEKTGKVALGHADTIDYDASKGVVRLTKNAWLTDGQNEVRGESLKYNVIAQSIIADAADQNSQRVHIIITPTATPNKP